MNKKSLAKALEDLDSAFENLEVKPLSAHELGRVSAAATVEIDGTCAATCNSKCGPTAYWECSTDACSWGCEYTTVYIDHICVW